MKNKYFLDTNVLVYAIDRTDERKHLIALDRLVAAHETGDGVVSYQVVQEWYNVVLRKSATPLSPDAAESIYRRLIEPLWRIQSNRELLNGALDLHRRHSFSWWDSLVVSAAIQGGCTCLVSEDLPHGRTIAGVTIENPFL